MNQPARIAHARWAMLAASLLLLSSCDREPQEIALAVSVVQWAQPDMPAEGVKVILEEQRLTNGIVNAFYTAGRTAHRRLGEQHTNVLAMRVRRKKKADEILDISPSSLVTTDAQSVQFGHHAPLLDQAEIDNANSPCPTTPMLYRIPEKWRRGVDVKRPAAQIATSSPGSLEGSTCYITVEPGCCTAGLVATAA